jgi:ABC-type multidrug transport system ATPase subunit
VPQEDIVFEDLSVQENLMFSAQMRLPADMSFEDKENIVLRVMRLLDLEKIANSIVGNAEKRGISGGQRKRVNIGIELCAMPDILFLDEPTSGLDASASLKIAESLSEMAAEGMLIVAIIHQPRFSLFEKFDNVLLLGEGSTVYFGPSKEALNYFEKYLNIPCPVHENPADFFLDSITENAKLAEQWKTYSADEEEFKLSDHDTFNNLVDDLFSPKSFVDISESVPKRDLPSTMQQLYLQIVRSMRQLIYGYSEVLFEFMIHLLAGAAVGSVYGTDWDLIRFPLMVCNSSLAIAVASVTASLRVFSRDRLVFWRESSVGVSLVAYFYGKIIVQLYQVFLLSLVFTVTLRALIFPEIGFLEFYLIYCGVSWYSSGLGMLISVVIDKSAMLASIVLSMILGGFFSGAYPYLKDLNGFMLATTGIAVTRWSSEALVILESRGLPQHMNYDDQLFFTGYDKNNLSSDVAMLIFLGFLFRFFILAVLRFKRQNLNRLKWLLELKNWIALPFIILGVVASSALYFIVGYSNLLMFGPLVFSSLFYVVFMACLHYYSYKRAIIEIPSSFTLLKINYTYRSRIWLAIQFIGDSFIVAALVLTVTKLVFPDFIGWFWISLCIASTALTKIIGLAACIRQSYSKSKILFQPQTNSNICYTILLTLCTASAIYLGFAVDYKIYPIPYVSCTIPFIATLMLAVWQCLTNLNRKFKMFMFFPIVIFEIITVIRYDFQVDSHEMHWILIGTLMIYPVWISMALLFIFSRVFCACSSFCFRGFTRSAIKELLTDSP